MKKSYRYGRLCLDLDKSQVFEDDPGNGTPAMVVHENEACATYWCAVNEGYLMGDDGEYRLTDNQIRWLESLEAKLQEFLYAKS